MEYDEIEVVGVPPEEAIIQDFSRYPYTAWWLPWTPELHGKVTVGISIIRIPPMGCPIIQGGKGNQLVR